MRWLSSLGLVARKHPWRSCFAVLAAGILLGLITIAIGLIPSNSQFKETTDGIEIFVYSDSAHSELVFPCSTKQFDWKATFDNKYFKSNSLAHPYIGVGWGDRDFFIETPTWEDIRVSTTARAMFWPTRSAIKVTYQDKPTEGPSVRSVKISKEQYKRLTEYVFESIRVDGKIQHIQGASHGENSRFFDANGKYHMFWTCNAWVGQGLKKSGIKVGCYTPLPKTVFWWL